MRWIHAMFLVCSLSVTAAVRGAEPDSAATTAVYRFLGGEKVRIIVPASIGETFEQIVSEDGTLSLPTGTAINLKGKTLQEARTLIADQLEKETHAKHVQVGVVIVEMTARKVYIAGEVRAPRPVLLTSGVPLNLLGALQEAGGISDLGDPTRVNIVHTESDGTQHATQVDSTKLAQPGSADLGPRLEAGDVVVVPRGETFLLSGEINRTGPVNRKDLSLAPHEPPHLSRVLLGAGGLKPTANRRSIRVLRLEKDGTRKILSANFEAITGQPAKEGEKPDEERADPILHDGDIVVVGAISTSTGVSILGKIKAPGVYTLTEHMKVSRLVSLAGGFSEFAKGSAVTISRASKPGSLIKVDVESIIKNGDWSKDVELEDGDIIFVSERMF